MYGAGKYLHGDCHVFALALHELYGYDIYCVEDLARERVCGDGEVISEVTHTFCMKNGKVIDANGVHSLRHMKGTLKVQCPRFGPPKWKVWKINGEIIRRHDAYLRTYNPVTPAKVCEAKEFICKHKECFTV